MVGFQFNRAFKIGQRAIDVVAQETRKGPLVPALGIVRRLAHGDVESGFGSLEIITLATFHAMIDGVADGKSGGLVKPPAPYGVLRLTSFALGLGGFQCRKQSFTFTGSVGQQHRRPCGSEGEHRDADQKLAPVDHQIPFKTKIVGWRGKLRAEMVKLSSLT
ncbi:hypothetical protein IMCC20628_00427 [Hoeflea sp. IMCC20628]|nr:hypothetical protein IMCC20628_00427 [Hoeflea sp. IMCC20628]